MTIIERSALLPYSDQAMFDLVNDIESYPHFMEGCQGAEVISHHGNKMTGRLDLGKAGITYSFSTCNFLDPPRSIEMELVEGPFRTFEARWDFEALRENACKVTLHMEFEFNRSIIDVVLKKIFEASSRNLVNSVCKRADEIYGS
ncbi:MAG: type II toxin-antitoxin system RatA family toxin [Pseudohongiellaceae bacterium]